MTHGTLHCMIFNCSSVVVGYCLLLAFRCIDSGEEWVSTVTSPFVTTLNYCKTDLHVQSNNQIFLGCLLLIFESIHSYNFTLDVEDLICM